MPVDIGPKIGIDGEAEFRKQLNGINQQLRTLGSEMKSVTSAFADGSGAEKRLAEQTRVLTEQIEAQEKKIKLLRNGLDKAADKYGEADSRTLKWEQAVHEATAQLNRMKKQLKDTENGVEDLDDSLGKSEGVLGKYGKALVAGFSVAAIVNADKEVAGSIMDLEESTREYRQIMSGIEASGENAGYSLGQTYYVLEKLNGVMGDLDAAKEATAQLQTLSLSQEQLVVATDAVIGSWNKLGGAAPIETLSESIAQTILAGKSTGAFADVLLAAGIAEDDFNKKLAAAADEGERTQLVLNTLANQGLVDLGKAYQENNAEIIKANKSQMELDQAWAGLGETLAPIANFMRETLAESIVWVTGCVEDAIEAIKKLVDWYNRMSQKVDVVDEFSGMPTYDGSHAGGLGYVPYDGYLAQLHKGEMVLTAGQAAMLRNSQGGVTTGQLQQAVSTAVNGMAMMNGGSSLPEEITLTLKSDDGQVMGRWLVPFVRSENRSNPEVVSDAI